MSVDNLFFCDAHCHLNNPLFKNNPMLWDQIRALGFRAFINSVLSVEDMLLQYTPLKQSFTAGLHPYLFNEQDFDLEDLEKLCKNNTIKAIGEIGIDRRYDNLNEQIELFIEQILLAKKYNLPVVFHCVKAHDLVASLCRKHYPQIKGFIHGFNASIEHINLFKNLKILFSVNYKFLKKRNAKEIINHLLVNNILLFETDIELKLMDNSSSVIDIYIQSSDMIKEICHYDKIQLDKLAQTQFKLLKNYSLI